MKQSGPKTREAKLGCVFTQTRLDDQGRPQRDDQSTTYVAAIETAEELWSRIYAEAVRCGLKRAQCVVVLGDGAVWIRNTAQFPGAQQIVDLYHSREHRSDVDKIVYGPASSTANDWAAGRIEQLDAGNIESVLTALRRLSPRDPKVRKEVRKAVTYFQGNMERMRYAQFRSEGLFVGSGSRGSRLQDRHWPPP